MDITYKKFFVITGAILVVVVLFILVATYVFRIESPAIDSIRKVLHLPAIIVDGEWISMKEIEENTYSIKQFYENQNFSPYGIRIDFTTEDGKKRLLLQERKMINKLIEDIAIEQIAQERSITLSKEAVQSAMDRPMNEMGTRDDVEAKLSRLYGWSLDDFGEKVVRGQLLREKVAAQFEQENEPSDDMRAQIISAKKELDDGRAFADIAARYSQGSTASESGVMGWFNEAQLQDEIGETIAKMSIGEYSDVLETSLGLHIVRVNDISQENEQKLVHISQIIVKKKTFASFLSERIATMNVRVFLPGYEWDQETGFMVFKDESMADFEQKMKEEAVRMQEEMLNKD